MLFISQMVELLFQSRYGFSENKSSWFVVSDLIIKRSRRKKRKKIGNTFRRLDTTLALRNRNTSSELYLQLCKHGDLALYLYLYIVYKSTTSSEFPRPLGIFQLSEQDFGDVQRDPEPASLNEMR